VKLEAGLFTDPQACRATGQPIVKLDISPPRRTWGASPLTAWVHPGIHSKGPAGGISQPDATQINTITG
jgi:hypothetical protein